MTVATLLSPSRAWVAVEMPLVDASPELVEATQAYLCALVWYRRRNRDTEARRAVDDAEGRVFELVGYSRAQFVAPQYVIRVVFDKTRGFADYVSLTPRWLPLRRRAELED